MEISGPLPVGCSLTGHERHAGKSLLSHLAEDKNYLALSCINYPGELEGPKN